MIFCFFGFYRNANIFTRTVNLTGEKDVYVFAPNIRAENLPNDKISTDMIISKFGENSTIILEEYNKQKHIDKAEKLNIPRFNQAFQQSYRIFSFFYNIKMVLQMVKNSNKYTDDDIIVLSRIDIGLTAINIDKIHEYIKDYDIIVGYPCGSIGTDDKWFIFKYKNIDTFISLYDDHEAYLTDYYHTNTKLSLPSTCPENVFFHHFKMKNMSTVNTVRAVIEFEFSHVCSEYCGHNGNNTKT